MTAILRQCAFIPKPTFTENELPDQTGRVLIVTGGYTGVGKELTKMLYSKNATIYIAGRAESKYNDAVREIKAAYPDSKGRLEFLQLDLSDLPTIKNSAQEFLQKEQRLDVLTNNAGVMTPPVGSKTPQNHELMIGTNCLGPYLFTSLLTPLLQKTAAASPPGTVRVTWAASIATYGAPNGGVQFSSENPSDLHVFNNPLRDYAQSKAGNVLLCREFAIRHSDSGIVSNAWNPGNLKSELQRHQKGIEKWFTQMVIFPTKFGGYTELYAGFAEEPGKEANWGKYIAPWGRFVACRKDIEESKVQTKFWEWCERETGKYR